MIKRILPIIILVQCVLTGCIHAQQEVKPAEVWADSVLHSLTEEQKIAQLMIVRASGFAPVTRDPVYFNKDVADAIRQYNIGGICWFQGTPVQQAIYTNAFQQQAKTPLMVCIDGENGLGMRIDSILPLPRQMMLGAIQDTALIYQYGQLVGRQCKRTGIQVNYAPVVDINNNAANPVINDRSFGENREIVSLYGIQYMRGMQDAGIMACAKHFPGHGDVATDSHYDLPVINKSRTQLDSLELYPFRKLIDAGVGSVMIAHLNVPALDKSNRPTSISYNAVTNVLRKEMKFTGITFTDALEMKGIAKYYPAGEASVESLVAGNDMLCLPGDIPGSIQKIKLAIANKRLTWDDINSRVRRVLIAKYNLGLAQWQPVVIDNLTNDLNIGLADMRRKVAEEAITLVKDNNRMIFPLMPDQVKRVAYIAIGATKTNAITSRMRDEYKADIYFFDNRNDEAKARAMLNQLQSRYDVVIAGVHNYSRFPARNFGVGNGSRWLVQQLQLKKNSILMVFGNPYFMSNTCNAQGTLLCCYEDDDITQDVAANILSGKLDPKGKLPVTVCKALPAGTGITGDSRLLPAVQKDSSVNTSVLDYKIDSIVNNGLWQGAYPGAVVLVLKDNIVLYEKAFGSISFQNPAMKVSPGMIYDLASVTKVCATTLAVMKLYEEGKLSLDKTIGDYLPWVKGSNKQNLKIKDLLLHQAGLKSYIPFYKETLDASGYPLPGFYATETNNAYNIRVAQGMYLKNDFEDTIYKRILQSELSAKGKYIYSDNDFIFLGKIVEAITQQPLDRYVKETFYTPLELKHTSFSPRMVFPIDSIVPTENEITFRRQLLQGDVHDQGSAMLGGIAGHAGLFGNARDLALIGEMLLNGGVLNGQRLLKPETIRYFTSYQNASRRGLGFDKPERDNNKRTYPYPCNYSSPETFGHTGFTGIGWWVDPKYNLVFVFLSNRVNAGSANYNKLISMRIREKVMDEVYKALK